MHRPVHFEILAEDPEKVVDFYREIFGWEVATWEGPQTYWLCTTGGRDEPGINGGVMHRHLPQSVINTITVDSVADMIARIEAAGGQKVHGPNQIPGIGLHAYCTDPEGTHFGIVEPLSD